MHRSVVVGLSTVGMLEANLTLNPIGPEALTCVVAAGLLVVGASHCAYRLQGGIPNWYLPASASGESNGNPLQYSCLENPMDRGAWWAAIHGVAKSQTRLSDSTFTFHFLASEKEMATHSSVLAWRIPGTEEPGRLPFMGSHRVRHD